MNCIKLLNYNYYYYNRDNNLEIKSLNIFQCIFRKVFGCYKETHLARVARQTFAISTSDASENLCEAGNNKRNLCGLMGVLCRVQSRYASCGRTFSLDSLKFYFDTTDIQVENMSLERSDREDNTIQNVSFRFECPSAVLTASIQREVNK